MFKFKLSYVAFASVLASTCVYADPTSWTHQSGATVIDIEAPNAAGVSHNMYREFNVSDKGTVLNNSATDVSHASLGNLTKNNNLAGGKAATVILNEVISNKSSALNGFIEVNGQKADVIIANPNGISCSGCSFINTNKAVLTTGNVKLSDTGAIASYNVTGGRINVDSRGMNAANSYAVLLADAISLNGVVNASNALISAGNSTLDNTTGVVTSAGKSANLMQLLIPEYSIDISSLGGVKANNITMVGNNLGFGVRNKGAVIANSTLAMTSYGSLINEGAINGNGYVTQLVSAGEMKNSGTIATNNIAAIKSMGALSNAGTISNTSQMTISSTGNLENTGTISGTNALSVSTSGDLTTTYGSKLKSDNQLSVAALGNITNGGSTYALNTNMAFGGESLKVTGNILGQNTLLIQAAKNGTATSGEITNAGTISGNNVTVTTEGTLATTAGSTLRGETSLNTHSYWLNNLGSISTGDNGEMYLDNMVLTNNKAYIVGGKNIHINTYLDMVNTGTIQSYGDLTIDTQNFGTITNQNYIVANGTMTLKAKKVVNGGYRCGFLNMSTCGVGTLAANKLILNSSHNYATDMGGKQSFKSIETNTVK